MNWENETTPKQQHFGACAFGVYIIVIMHHWSRG
jgi:hypothetical protein